MENKESMYTFLKSNGFKPTDRNISTSFGDYYETFTNDTCELRFSSSKSFETVDIRNVQQGEEWYDLALVKALLHNERELNNVTTIEEHSEFLKKELNHISNLFNDKNYSSTKKKLDELANERAKQMFPGMIK